MKHLLILLSFCFIKISSAQTNIYHPMPDSNAVWRVDMGWAMCYPIASAYQYTINGDTLIGSDIYKKIYVAGVFDICNGGYWYNNIYSGALRNDTLTRMVFYVDIDSTFERILYNFILNVGDTVVRINQGLGAIADTIISIDSVLVGSNYHKRFNTFAFSTIEGVGSTVGLLELDSWSFETHYNLNCFKNNSDIYPNFFPSCQLIDSVWVNTSEIPNPEITISPNPATTQLTITTNSPEKSEIIIYDLLSQKLIEESFTNTTTINTSLLAKGIYLYEVRTAKGEAQKGKVVIE